MITGCLGRSAPQQRLQTRTVIKLLEDSGQYLWQMEDTSRQLACDYMVGGDSYPPELPSSCSRPPANGCITDMSIFWYLFALRRELEEHATSARTFVDTAVQATPQ